MIKCLCDLYPLISHFCLVKLGFTGLYIFLFLLYNKECGYSVRRCKHRFCSSTDFVHIEQKWLATATEIVVLTKMVAISTDFVHFGQKW